MKVLVVKTSSMGDVIHTLPALTDAHHAFPDVSFDWLVEKNFAQIPSWHPAVDRVIEVEFRKWRKMPWQALREGHWQHFYSTLTQKNYDYVLDAQGLFKSACMSLLAKGKRFGLNRHSAREPLATVLYNHRINVPKHLHAVTRTRQLFAKTLGYTCPVQLPNYDITAKFAASAKHSPVPTHPYVMFLQGTTWETKLWPEVYWQALAHRLANTGIAIYIPWGNALEKARAEKIAADQAHVHVLPSMSLFELANYLAQAKGVVAVDTGLGHLACALAVPTITLYGPTNANLTGTLGTHQTHMSARFACAPCLQEKCTYPGAHVIAPACFAQITPEVVYNRMKMSLFFSESCLN
jgi:heptosyltransferase-1